jgi:regulator of sirC expression with transglutaminase-like and TPR domain
VRDLLSILRGDVTPGRLDYGAMEIAAIEFPGIEPEPYVAMLDNHAQTLGSRVGPEAPGEDFVTAAGEYFFGEVGLAGDPEYQDPRNSCLNEVLTRRLGIPISLSLVYLEVARRLQRPVRGIGLPGHFVVKYDDGRYSTFIDPFGGGTLMGAMECFELASKATDTKVPYDPAFLAPVNESQIFRRMLNNLRWVYLQRQEYGKALQVLDLLLRAFPDAADEHKQRAVVRWQLSNASGARADFERYLALAGDPPDRQEVEELLMDLRKYLAALN